MIQHQRHPHLVEWPLATSDPGDAATSRGLASIGGADVQTLPDPNPPLCRECGAPAANKGKRMFCSFRCSVEYRKRARVPRTCATCHVEFTIAPKRAAKGGGVYCSWPCMHQGRIGKPTGVRTTTHGLSRLPEYRTWKTMRNRCNNPNNHKWPIYGGRGITICPEWDDFAVFLRDMGRRPPGTSIDRIDVDGNYEPSNCRWATALQQVHNRRPQSEWKKPKPKAPAKCGTVAGYYRHHREGTTPCVECLTVNRERQKLNEQRRKAKAAA